MSGPLTIAADDRCSAHSDLCSRVELQSTTTIGDGSVHIDTVFYPKEVESSKVASREDAPPPPLGAAVAGEASGVAVCYSGLLRGFGGLLLGGEEGLLKSVALVLELATQPHHLHLCV